jgi:GDP-4-dehydro-6-deoxy-D-mannose reductase
MRPALHNAPCKVLIAGGSGFVGRALAAHALGEGAEVATLSRRATLPPVAGAAAHAADLMDLDATVSLLEAARPDVVFHAAGSTTPASDFSDRQSLWQANVAATENLLESVRRVCPEAVVIAVGSAAQYGPPRDPTRLIHEDDSWRPTGCYGVTKAAAGMAVLERAARGHVRATLGVLFNLVGPGQPGHLVPQTFIDRMVGPGPYRIDVGDVGAERDFIDVRDAARALWDLAFLVAGGSAAGLAFNICSGEPMRIADVLGILRLVSGGNLSWTPHGGADPVRRVVGDPTRLRHATGFAPKIALTQSIHDAWEAHRGRVRLESAERGRGDVVLERA